MGNCPNNFSQRKRDALVRRSASRGSNRAVVRRVCVSPEHAWPVTQEEVDSIERYLGGMIKARVSKKSHPTRE